MSHPITNRSSLSTLLGVTFCGGKLIHEFPHNDIHHDNSERHKPEHSECDWAVLSDRRRSTGRWRRCSGDLRNLYQLEKDVSALFAGLFNRGQ
jgi:hypothetical protein